MGRAQLTSKKEIIVTMKKWYGKMNGLKTVKTEFSHGCKSKENSQAFITIHYLH